MSQSNVRSHGLPHILSPGQVFWLFASKTQLGGGHVGRHMKLFHVVFYLYGVIYQMPQETLSLRQHI